MAFRLLVYNIQEKIIFSTHNPQFFSKKCLLQDAVDLILKQNSNSAVKYTQKMI